MSLQDNLRTLRERAGYTQAKDFAENILKMSYSTYMGYETRGTWPNEETLIKIATALGVSIDDLLGYKKDAFKEASDLVSAAIGKVKIRPDGTISIPMTEGVGVMFHNKNEFLEWFQEAMDAATLNLKDVHKSFLDLELQKAARIALIAQLEKENPGITYGLMQEAEKGNAD